MSQITFTLDVADDETNAGGFDLDFANIIAQHGGRIVYFQYSGPGGGNPAYGITAPNLDAARAILVDAGFPSDERITIVADDAFDYHRSNVA